MLDLSPLWISLRIATIATGVTFFLGIAVAQFMQGYRGRWRSLLDGLLLAPLVLPPTVLGFLLLLLLGKNGPLGKLLDGLGLNVVFTWYAAIITATVVAFPLMYKTVLGALTQIDSSLLQAARTLGASELQLFRQVTLPLALPGIVAGTTLAFARALGEFGATLMLAGNIPGKTQTIPMAIYFAVEAGAFREAAIWTAVILAITLGGLGLVNSGLVWQGQGRHEDAGRGGRAVAVDFPRYPLPATPLSACSLPAAHLSVSLIKHLPGFTLDVSFSTDQQHLGLLGASGAGKSLILRCIAGTETPDAGRIVLNGRVLFDSVRGINVPSCDRNVAIVFQNYALFPHLTVAQNVVFGLPRGLSERQRQGAVAQQLAAVHLQGLGHRRPAALSGGQQQRVALARALASQPEVLLLDEPFAALDTHLRHQIERDLRLRLTQFSGLTLLVTHNIEEAYRICSRLLVIDRGGISIHDSKYAVLDHPATVSAARLTGCKNLSRVVPTGPGTLHALDWNCRLQVTAPVQGLPDHLTHIGMRAHQFEFLEALGQNGGAATPRSMGVQGRGSEEDRRDGAGGENRRDSEVVAPVPSPSPHLSTPSACFSPLSPSAPNTFACWLTMTSETPHRMTLYLKLNEPPAHAQDYHLQAEVFKAKWAVLREMPLPWSVVLPPERLMLLSDRVQASPYS
jgi:molybdate transport system permease protein